MIKSTLTRIGQNRFKVTRLDTNESYEWDDNLTSKDSKGTHLVLRKPEWTGKPFNSKIWSHFDKSKIYEGDLEYLLKNVGDSIEWVLRCADDNGTEVKTGYQNKQMKKTAAENEIRNDAEDKLIEMLKLINPEAAKTLIETMAKKKAEDERLSKISQIKNEVTATLENLSKLMTETEFNDYIKSITAKKEQKSETIEEKSEIVEETSEETTEEEVTEE